jgi:hypothetical protein
MLSGNWFLANQETLLFGIPTVLWYGYSYMIKTIGLKTHTRSGCFSYGQKKNTYTRRVGPYLLLNHGCCYFYLMNDSTHSMSSQVAMVLASSRIRLWLTWSGRMRVGFGGDLMIRLLVVFGDTTDKDNTWIQHSHVTTLQVSNGYKTTHLLVVMRDATDQDNDLNPTFSYSYIAHIWRLQNDSKCEWLWNVPLALVLSQNLLLAALVGDWLIGGIGGYH